MFKTISLHSRSLRRLSTSSKYPTYPWLKKTHEEIWTPDNIVKPIFPDVHIPDITLTELVWSRIERWPTKTAIVCK